jgi:hypothetical protein
MVGKKPYKTYKKTTVKADKAPAYKPKRGLNDGSGFMVQGEGLGVHNNNGRYPLSIY